MSIGILLADAGGALQAFNHLIRPAALQIQLGQAVDRGTLREGDQFKFLDKLPADASEDPVLFPGIPGRTQQLRQQAVFQRVRRTAGFACSCYA